MSDSRDIPPLVDSLTRLFYELPDHAPEKSFFPSWANMPDGDIGTLLMISAIICLATGFGLQFIKEGERFVLFYHGTWEIKFPKWTGVFVLMYYFGLLMTIRETQVFGLFEYFRYLVAITAIGLALSVLLGWFGCPTLRFIIRVYYSILRFKEAIIILLVTDYGLPQNAKELVGLFAKKRLRTLYTNVQKYAAPYICILMNLRNKIRISFTILMGSMEEKIREVRKLVA